MPHSTPVISINSYRFYFDKPQTLRLPEYAGSAWRGALGHALKRTVCVVRNTPCNQCLLQNACAYSYIFETPPPANSEKMRKYTAAPHPFVLQLDQAIAENPEQYSLNLILFGHGQRYLPYLIQALKTAGEDGIGASRQPLQLLKIDHISHNQDATTIYQNGSLAPQANNADIDIPPMPNSIEITLHTPVRIKQDGKNLTAASFNFGAFFNTLLRRISLISYFHTDTPLETDFAGLSQQARTIQFNSQQLKWYDWTRFSSRQKTEMNMGGVVGTLQLNMAGLENFWPYLWLGQWTHLGKGTSMGMGAYSIKISD
jgi:hypothetical protein